MTKPQFPEHVPYLKPKHIYKGWYNGPNGTHCLIGWVTATFASFETRKHVVKLLAKAINKKSTNYFEGVVVNFNDAGTTSPQRICNVWNKVMEKLGYTEEV